MTESSSREASHTLDRRWRSWWVRGLVGVLVFLVCFIGHRTWEVGEQAAAVEQCEGNGGNVNYHRVYPRWVQALGIQSWFHENTFRKIVSLSYASDADLERLENAFNLKALYSLCPLNAKECSAEALKPLSRFPRLFDLSLTGDMINPEILKQTLELPELSSLSLVSGKLDDMGLQHLASHPTLAVLRISGCDLETVTPGNLSKLPHLTSLFLSNLKWSDSNLTGFSHAPLIETVVIYNVDLSSTGYEELAKLPQLQELELYGPDITPEKLARFAKARKPESLTYQHSIVHSSALNRTLHDRYRLPGNWNSSKQTSQLIDQTKMYSIFVDSAGTPFHGSKQQLSQMALHSYSLAEPKSLEEELSILIKQNHLKILNINQLPISARLEETLAGLNKLEVMTFWECPLSDEMLKRLQTNLPNCSIQNQSSDNNLSRSANAGGGD